MGAELTLAQQRATPAKAREISAGAGVQFPWERERFKM